MFVSVVVANGARQRRSLGTHTPRSPHLPGADLLSLTLSEHRHRTPSRRSTPACGAPWGARAGRAVCVDEPLGIASHCALGVHARWVCAGGVRHRGGRRGRARTDWNLGCGMRHERMRGHATVRRPGWRMDGGATERRAAGRGSAAVSPVRPERQSTPQRQRPERRARAEVYCKTLKMINVSRFNETR